MTSRKGVFTDMTATERQRGGMLFVLYLAVLPWATGLVFNGVEQLWGWTMDSGVQNMVDYYLLSVLTVAVFWGFLGRTTRCFFANLRGVLQTVGIGLAAFYLLNELSYRALSLLLPAQKNLNDITISAQLEQSPRSMILVLVFLAPFIEEVLFRGYVFGNIREVSRPAAYAVSCLLFAFLHVWQFAWMQHKPAYLLLMAQYFVPGLVMAWVYEKSGTLWGSVLLHGLINALAVWSVS